MSKPTSHRMDQTKRYARPQNPNAHAAPNKPRRIQIRIRPAPRTWVTTSHGRLVILTDHNANPRQTIHVLLLPRYPNAI